MKNENYSYPPPKMTDEEKQEFQQMIADERAKYSWEQKMELRLLQMYFTLEDWYGEWRAEREKRSIAAERELLSCPGDTILETIQEKGITRDELAEAMNITQASMDDLISGKQPIAEIDAIGLQQCLGIDKQFWINREKLYREKLKWIEEQEKNG